MQHLRFDPLFRGTWIIDNFGFWHTSAHLLASGPWLARRYGAAFKGDFVGDFGFISVKCVGERAHVRLCSEAVSEVAVADLLYWLGECRARLISVECVSRSNVATLFCTPEQAVAHVVTLLNRRDLRRRFSEQTVALGSLDPASELKGLLDLWHNGGRDDPELLQAFATEHLKGRFTRVRNRNGDLIFDEFGPGMQLPAWWCRNSIGKPVARLPDTMYFREVANRKHLTLQSEHPHFSRITARIHWPGQGWVDENYQRLMLPCHDRYGDQVLFTAF